jgi:hypothetical protein
VSAALTALERPKRSSRLAAAFSGAAALAGRLRLKNPWNYKAPFLISLPYFMSAVGRIPASRALLGLLASLLTIFGIAATAYLLNDWSDTEKDRAGGKPNAVAQLGLAQRGALLLAFLSAALLPWLYLPFTRLTGALLAAELGLFVVYCFPPFRLKERGVLGLLTDACYAHALPAVLAVVTFAAMAPRPYPQLASLLLALLAWQLALGVRNITLHQLQDHDSDLRSGTRTVATAVGPERLSAWLTRAVVPLELFGFTAFTLVAARGLPALLWAYPAFVLLTLARRRALGLPVLPAGARGLLYAFLDDFYVDWLPLAVLFSLLAIEPGYWPLLVIHLLLFRSGLRQLGQELWSRAR